MLKWLRIIAQNLFVGMLIVLAPTLIFSALSIWIDGWPIWIDGWPTTFSRIVDAWPVYFALALMFASLASIARFIQVALDQMHDDSSGRE
jgi:hypothetical protein